MTKTRLYKSIGLTTLFVTFTVVQPFRNFISLCSLSQPCKSDQKTTRPHFYLENILLPHSKMEGRKFTFLTGFLA